MCVVNSLIALANTARTLGDKEALRELVSQFDFIVTSIYVYYYYYHYLYMFISRFFM